MNPARALSALLLLVWSAAALPAQVASAEPPASDGEAIASLPSQDRVRLAEAFRLSNAIGERIWHGWHEAPFAVLLVTADHEFLARHPAPSPDFRLVGYDSLLGSDVYTRRRVFGRGMLATFPAVGGVPTVVIGQAEHTEKSSTEWVLTVLHEHLHQLQYSQPDYYRKALALELHGGDSTGMWMLDYSFPYDSAVVQRDVAALGHALVAVLSASDERLRRRALDAYRAARAQLQSTLSPEDYRYVSMQLWQEGVARFVEYEAARLAAAQYAPTPAFRALPDHEPFGDVEQRRRGELLRELGAIDLASSRRIAFYPLGAATAIILDRAAPGWRDRYLEAMFSLDDHLP